MNMNDFVKNFENAIGGIQTGSLNAKTEFSSIEQWDSLAALSILAMVSTEYGVELAAEELKNSKTIEDLFHIMEAKKQ